MFLTSPGVSVIAAGIVSGLCFFVIHGIRKGKAAQAEKEAKEKRDRDNSRCACCLKPFVIDRVVECGDCESRICRKGCSRWHTTDNVWYCLFCHQRRSWLRRNEKWFQSFGGLSADHDDETHRFNTAKSQVYLAGAEYAGVGPGVGLAAGGEEDEGESLERVRTFIERIVEGLVGDVDEILIDRLYDHVAYDQLLENYKQPLAGALARLAVSLQLSIINKPATDTPAMAHAALRELVERAVEEARKLPGLGSSDAGRSAEPRDISDQTYEDLLATAILNKVIEKYQNERVEENSNTERENKTSPKQKYITSEIEVGLDEGVEEGSSSLEPMSQDEYSSDCSGPPQKYSLNRQEPLSLTIEEHIEEVTTTYTSDEEEQENVETNKLDFRNAHRVPFPEFGMDIIDPSQESSEEVQDEALTPTHVDLVTPVESWEENWLFQKKKMQAQSEPVSMLVPNPSEDFKPLIGDREADDTSDLSDCSAQSDEEIEEELFEAINNVVPRTRESQGDAKVLSSLIVKEAELTNNVNKIEDQHNLIKSQVVDPELRETGTNGILNEQRNEGEVKTPEIKLGIADTLVFHMKTKEMQKYENKTENRSQSTEFIEREKLLGHSASIEENIDETKTESEPTGVKVESDAFVNIERKKERRNLDRTWSSSSTVKIDDAVPANEEKKIEMNGNAEKYVELTRDLKPHEEKEVPLNVVWSDSTVDKVNEEQLVNLTDDLQVPEISKTPMPSPRNLETQVSETGASLDEKLVSIETRIDTTLDSFDDSLNSFVINNENVIKSSDNINDSAQQESEYTEHYDTATQRHLDSLTRPAKNIDQALKETDPNDHDDIPPPIPSTPPPIGRLRQCREAAAFANVEDDSTHTIERKRVEVDLFLATPPRPGTIAEREHKKWENAAPIENNPYSEENIQKRLWQRQYSRNISSSDTSVAGNSEVTKVNGSSVQVVLGAGQPDVKRYGRDYYINEAKIASGEHGRRIAALSTGRPNSSLSQNSSSFDDEHETQEKIQYQESDQTLNTTTELKTKVTTWQQNNIDSNNSNVIIQGRQRVETTIHLVAPDEVDGNETTKKSSIAEVDGSWEEDNTEEILENVRRNSKNELNAKLNKQEDAERLFTGSDVRKSFVNGHQKSIHRIDLKAFGFDNEKKTNSNSVRKITEQRVVNKLDLKSYGYGSELERIQSVGNIDRKLNNEIIAKPRIVKMKTKSNLTEYHPQRERSKSSHNLVEYEASGDFNKTLSTEILNEDKNFSDVFEEFGGMTSAKSMPNVTRIEHYSQKLIDGQGYKDEDDNILKQFNTRREKFREEEERLRREMIRASSTSHGLWKSETTIFSGEKTGSNGFSSEDELDDIIIKTRSTEVLTKKQLFEKTMEQNTFSPGNMNEDLPMPSVRRLAQAFIKPPAEKPTATPRVLKTHSHVKKERPTTPEVHIIETPRQMHSLTARSLSREFREGLRQIPNKMTPPAGLLITEQTTEDIKKQSKVVSSEVDSSIDDLGVIAPGKLKNNIKFWEQLQKQS